MVESVKTYRKDRSDVNAAEDLLANSVKPVSESVTAVTGPSRKYLVPCFCRGVQGGTRVLTEKSGERFVKNEVLFIVKFRMSPLPVSELSKTFRENS